MDPPRAELVCLVVQDPDEIREHEVSCPPEAYGVVVGGRDRGATRAPVRSLHVTGRITHRLRLDQRHRDRAHGTARAPTELEWKGEEPELVAPAGSEILEPEILHDRGARRRKQIRMHR